MDAHIQMFNNKYNISHEQVEWNRKIMYFAIFIIINEKLMYRFTN